MSFVLRNAAQTFQRFIGEILRRFDFCFAYIDDILVYSRSPEEHERHLRPSSGSYRPTGSCSTPANMSFEPQKLHSSATGSHTRDHSRCHTEYPTSRLARRPR